MNGEATQDERHVLADLLGLVQEEGVFPEYTRLEVVQQRRIGALDSLEKKLLLYKWFGRTVWTIDALKLLAPEHPFAAEELARAERVFAELVAMYTETLDAVHPLGKLVLRLQPKPRDSNEVRRSLLLLLASRVPVFHQLSVGLETDEEAFGLTAQILRVDAEALFHRKPPAAARVPVPNPAEESPAIARPEEKASKAPPDPPTEPEKDVPPAKAESGSMPFRTLAVVLVVALVIVAMVVFGRPRTLCSDPAAPREISYRGHLTCVSQPLAEFVICLEAANQKEVAEEVKERVGTEIKAGDAKGIGMTAENSVIRSVHAKYSTGESATVVRTCITQFELKSGAPVGPPSTPAALSALPSPTIPAPEPVSSAAPAATIAGSATLARLASKRDASDVLACTALTRELKLPDSAAEYRFKPEREHWAHECDFAAPSLSIESALKQIQASPLGKARINQENQEWLWELGATPEAHLVLARGKGKAFELRVLVSYDTARN